MPQATVNGQRITHGKWCKHDPPHPAWLWCSTDTPMADGRYSVDESTCSISYCPEPRMAREGKPGKEMLCEYHSKHDRRAGAMHLAGKIPSDLQNPPACDSNWCENPAYQFIDTTAGEIYMCWDCWNNWHQMEWGVDRSHEWHRCELSHRYMYTINQHHLPAGSDVNMEWYDKNREWKKNR